MTITGTPNADSLTGTSAGEFIYGGAGNDTIHAGDGGDAVHGEAGSDLLYGEGGNDFLTGGDAAPDTMFGGTGNDTLRGQAGADSMDGGDGDDELSVYDGNIALGGAGADEFLVQDTGAFDRLVIDGGAGIDRVDFYFSAVPSEVWLNVTRTTGFEIRNVEHISFQSNDQSVTVHGGSAAETVIGSNWADSMIGGGGDDELFGRYDNDTLEGGAGDDILVGGLGANVLAGGAGIDTADYSNSEIPSVSLSLAKTGPQANPFGAQTLSSIERLIGSEGDDGLRGDDRDNTISGGDGSDIIGASLGADVLGGGSGLDRISFEGLADTVWFDFNTGEVRIGEDAVSQATSIESATAGWGHITIVLSWWAGDLIGNGAKSTVSYEAFEWGVNVDLSTHQAFLGLVGSEFSDTLMGRQLLADTVRGGAGDDFIRVTTGNDIYDGGDGIDTLALSPVDGQVRTVDLAARTTWLPTDGVQSFSGIEKVAGSTGAEVFFASKGDDVIDGGVGAARDLISYEMAKRGVSVDLSLQTVQRTGGSGLDMLSNVEDITGSAFDDLLGAGLSGSTLQGGAGDDILISGAQNDRLDGGAGTDAVWFAGAWNGVNVDLARQTAQQTGRGSDLIVGVENLIGFNGDDALAGNDDVNALVGGKGADILAGRGGNDGLDGGAGRDRLLGGSGADVLAGGKGVDVFDFKAVEDSAVGGSDLITDLKRGDVVDVSAIDANTTAAGNQAFHLVGAFSGQAGEAVLSYKPQADRTVLSLDVNGDGLADMAILMDGDHRGFAGFVL